MLYIFIAAIIVIGTIGVFYACRVEGEIAWSWRSAAIGAVAFVTWAIVNSAYQVSAGHVGVVYEFGGIVGQTGEGLQWVTPWKSVKEASVQVQGHSFDKLDSFSQESQDVFVAATINIQVSPENIQALYRNVGPQYFDVLVRPRIQQAFKDETVKYRSVDIAPHREAIRKAVRDRLTLELRERSIIVEDLLIDNINFSQAFQASVERKQVASQDALAEEQKIAAEKNRAAQAIEQSRGRAEAVLIEATAQATANAKLAASITPELVQYQMVHKLAPNVSVMMLPAGAPFILSPDMLKR